MKTLLVLLVLVHAGVTLARPIFPTLTPHNIEQHGRAFAPTPELDGVLNRRDPMSPHHPANTHPVEAGPRLTKSQLELEKSKIRGSKATLEAAIGVVNGYDSASRGFAKAKVEREKMAEHKGDLSKTSLLAVKAVGHRAVGIAKGLGIMTLSTGGAVYQTVRGGGSLASAGFHRVKEMAQKEKVVSEEEDSARQLRFQAQLEKLKKSKLPVADRLYGEDT